MIDRYARHSLIPDWNQKSLADAKVIVVGMGALGNEVSRILAMAGVGQMILCDPDRIEASNLSRMVLFRESDIGHYKAEVAAISLQALSPGIVIQARPKSLVQGVGLAELRDASLVLSCLDSRSARLQLAGRCQLVRAVLIDGGTHAWGGEVRPYLDPDGPCYGCSLTTEERAIADAPWSCLDTVPIDPLGAAIPSSALVGTWMGMVAVRFLMRLNYPSEILKIDGSRGTTTVLKQERDPECPLHLPLEHIQPVSVSAEDTLGELRQVLPSGSSPIGWEAVQQLVECPTCGFTEIRWGIPSLDPCPQCNNTLRPRTTMELENAPDHLTLAKLGIPPREILTVRTDQGLQWFELKQ